VHFPSPLVKKRNRPIEGLACIGPQKKRGIEKRTKSVHRYAREGTRAPFLGGGKKKRRGGEEDEGVRGHAKEIFTLLGRSGS